MNNRIRTGFLAVLGAAILLGCVNTKEEIVTFCAPQTLNGQQFASEFYHYVNYYSFETDSTGFSENGQLFWSIALDTTSRSAAMDSVMYEYPEAFRYSIIDSVLTIEYTSPDHPDTDHFRVFHFNCKKKQWIGTHEYAYGREYLQEVEEKILEQKW